jgi:hypothetical protein
MSESDKTERLYVMADLCDVVLEAQKRNLLDRQEAESHLELYLSEVRSLIEKKSSEDLPF